MREVFRGGKTRREKLLAKHFLDQLIASKNGDGQKTTLEALKEVGERAAEEGLGIGRVITRFIDVADDFPVISVSPNEAELAFNIALGMEQAETDEEKTLLMNELLRTAEDGVSVKNVMQAFFVLEHPFGGNDGFTHGLHGLTNGF